MGLPKIDEIKDLTADDLEKEILNIKKKLFKLRIARKTKKEFKSHQLKHEKHRLAQLLMIQNKN